MARKKTNKRTNPSTTIIVPRGNGKEAVKERERIIREFYKTWRLTHEGQRMYNFNLKAFINIRQISMIETAEHASKSYLSTLAVLQLDAILTNAKKDKTVLADKKTKNQAGYNKMLIMSYSCPGIGQVKLTVGVARRTLEKIQYCITALEGTPNTVLKEKASEKSDANLCPRDTQ